MKVLHHKFILLSWPQLVSHFLGEFLIHLICSLVEWQLLSSLSVKHCYLLSYQFSAKVSASLEVTKPCPEKKAACLPCPLLCWCFKRWVLVWFVFGFFLGGGGGLFFVGFVSLLLFVVCLWGLGFLSGVLFCVLLFWGVFAKNT